MKATTHGNGRGLDDLYVLPENEHEKQDIMKWLDAKDQPFAWNRSDVPGQDWQGKWFLDIPFGAPLLDELSAALAQQGGA